MDLSKKVVSPFNNLYNQMIHKCNVTDITYIKDVCLDHTTGYNPYTTTTETSDLLNRISLDLKIKNKWWRWNGLKDAWGTLSGRTLFIIGIQSTTFYTQDIEQINVVTEIGLGTNDFVILKEDVEFIKIDSTNALIPSIIGDFKEVLTSTVYGVTLNLYSLSEENRYYHPDWKLLI